MARNQIMIVSNTKKPTLAFYMKSELQEWRLVSNDSVLSRKEYINSSIADRAEDIIRVINSVYNPGNRGVDILFEGEEKEFLLLKKAIDDSFSHSNITCGVMSKSHIAVAGKVGAGKSTLIKGLCGFKFGVFHCCESEGALLYTDDNKTTVWYEMPGIGFGAENLTNARKTFEKLVKSGITTFIYCLGTTKIEASEEELIFFVRDKYPEIKILVVLTQFVDDEQTLYAEQLSGNLDGIKVIPTLAMDMNTKVGVVSAYGLDDIDRYIFEGK